MKLRYIFVTIFLYYLVLLMIMVVVETFYQQVTADSIQAKMRTAGDTALEYSQHVDDLLSFREDDAYRMLMNTGGVDFESEAVFEAMWGIDVSEDGLEEVYDRLYNNDEFFDVMELSKDIKVPLRYYEFDPDLAIDRFPSLVWYEIPRALTLGADFLQSVNGVQSVRRVGGGEAPDMLEDVIELYGFTDVVREVQRANAEDEEMTTTKYFNTPLNMGLTYLNRELLSAVFANNMDIGMRTKYRNGVETSSDVGCEDFVMGESLTRTETYICGLAYNQLSFGGEALDSYNPVSDGRFTYLRYDAKGGSTSGGSLYEGLPVKIEYKLVDMHDSSSDPLLTSIWGNKIGEEEGGTDKAAYFRELNEGKTQNFESELQGFYDEYPIIVAKVTFYADIIIPYFTPTFRGLAGEFGDADGYNFLDILPRDTASEGSLGSRRFEYTRFFAVSP